MTPSMQVRPFSINANEKNDDENHDAAVPGHEIKNDDVHEGPAGNAWKNRGARILMRRSI